MLPIHQKLMNAKKNLEKEGLHVKLNNCTKIDLHFLIEWTDSEDRVEVKVL